MTAKAIARRAALSGAMLHWFVLSASSAQTYKAVLHEDDREMGVGEVTVDDHARIEVIAAESGRMDWLRRLVQRMNEKDVMYVEAPAPKGSGRTALASRAIRRGDPQFVPALKDYLRTYYNVELRAP